MDSHASPCPAGTSARAPPLSTVMAPKLEATILHPTVPSGSMNAQQSQEPLLPRTRTSRSIYPNGSTLGSSEISDRPEMALAMALGTTILPHGSISTKSRRKGLKRSKKGYNNYREVKYAGRQAPDASAGKCNISAFRRIRSGSYEECKTLK